MRYFTKHEFREHYDVMSDRILDVIDDFRHHWGAAVHVSPNAAALARHLGSASMSGHNVDRWDKCEAADLFAEALETPEDMQRAHEIAKKVGATGFGGYTDTAFRGKPHHMIHLDTRPDRTPENMRTWARVDGDYVALKEILPK
jgi:hypothetical protein